MAKALSGKSGESEPRENPQQVVAGERPELRH
jgi:hypothetical protein